MSEHYPITPDKTFHFTTPMGDRIRGNIVHEPGLIGSVKDAYDPHQPMQYPPAITGQPTIRAQIEWLELELSRERKRRRQLEERMLEIERFAGASNAGQTIKHPGKFPGS